MERKERITQAFNYLIFKGVVKTKVDLAEKMNLTRSTVSNALNGNNKYLTDSFIIKFDNTFRNIFQREWLLNEEGEMLINNEPSFYFEQNIGSNVNQGNSNTITTSANNDIVGRLLDELALQRQHSDTLAKQNQELIDLLRKKIDKE